MLRLYLMLSRLVSANNIGAREGFRWRGGEISRIEGLSDAVFGFSVTLLIVSGEVPKTFTELVEVLKAFVPFAVCFVQLMGVWYTHYLYYRRYGLEDLKSIVLTMLLLFVVLLYTYPLKFVFMSLFGAFGMGGHKGQYELQSYEQLSHLFTIYALGFIAVFGVFFLMHLHAYQSRHTLELTELEIWDTKHVIREMLMYCGVGLFSLTLANVLEGAWIQTAGLSYSLLGVVGTMHGTWSGKRRKAIFHRLYPAESPEALATS